LKKLFEGFLLFLRMSVRSRSSVPSAAENPTATDAETVHDRLPVTPLRVFYNIFSAMTLTGCVCEPDANTPKFGYYIKLFGEFGFAVDKSLEIFAHWKDIVARNPNHARASLKPGEIVEFQLKLSPNWQNYQDHRMFQAARVTGPGGDTVQGEEEGSQKGQMGGAGGSGGGGDSQAPPEHQAPPDQAQPDQAPPMPFFPGNYTFYGLYPIQIYQPVLNQMQGPQAMYSTPPAASFAPPM